MNRYTIDGYERISKAAARKLFDQGKTFYIQSCNMRPVNVWQSAYEINPEQCKENGDSFSDVVNSYEYYNTDSQRGRYAAFYIKG